MMTQLTDAIRRRTNVLTSLFINFYYITFVYQMLDTPHRSLKFPLLLCDNKIRINIDLLSLFSASFSTTSQTPNIACIWIRHTVPFLAWFFKALDIFVDIRYKQMLFGSVLLQKLALEQCPIHHFLRQIMSCLCFVPSVHNCVGDTIIYHKYSDLEFQCIFTMTWKRSPQN